MIKINGKKYETKEVLKIEIEDKVYSLPLLKHLKYKELKKLIALQSDNSSDLDSMFDVLSMYIPRDVLEELSVSEIMDVMDAWKSVSEGTDLGN